jgi:hypothetical protein
MPDYSNGKIYKLVSDKTNMIYIGSTKRSLKERIREHKKTFKHNIGLNTSKKLFELGGNISIELIKLFPCNCKKELEKEEGEYIKKYKKICVNKFIAGRTVKEYYKDNNTYLKKYIKIYREEYSKEIKESNKKYYESHKEKINEKYKCVCGSEIFKRNKLRHEGTIKHISFINNNK